MRNVLLALLMLSLTSIAMAQTVAVNPDHPDRYTVVKGDTLWDISGMFLRDPWRWPQIWKHNPEIENPHLIYPGDVIYLTYQDGKPVLSLERGNRVVKLSPQIHKTPNSESISSIPLELIRPFLSRSRVVSQNEIDSSGYIFITRENRLIAGTGDTVYARNLIQGDSEEYMIFRPGQAYYDPEDSDRLLGYQATYVATATLIDSADPSTLRIVDSRMEVLEGDRLLPLTSDSMPSQFTPQAPDELLEGYIVGVLNGIARIGQYQVVVLSLGDHDGVKPADILEVWQAGAVVEDRIADEDVQLPDTKAGIAMVFRVFDGTSYALIMNADKEMFILDKVMTPE